MLRVASLLAALVLAVPACAASPSAADAPAAVATVYPLAWLVDQIAPDVTTTFVGQGGQEPHDLSLSPADRAAIQAADVVVYLGDIGFQPEVEEAVATAPGSVVAVDEVVADGLLHTPDGGVDPHVWFDAALMAEVATATGEAFAHVDGDDADDYRARAAAVADRLRGLAAEVDALLEGCAHDQVIVSHAAYAYLLAPRDLAQRGIVGVAGHHGASPQALAELAAELRAHSISFILAEPVEGRADAEALAAETGAELLDIHTLEVVSEEEAARGYPELLRDQAERFAAALECDS